MPLLAVNVLESVAALVLGPERLECSFGAFSQSIVVTCGVAFAEPPRREPYGTVAVFADPFGNRWDLIEPARAAFADP